MGDNNHIVYKQVLIVVDSAESAEMLGFCQDYDFGNSN